MNNIENGDSETVKTALRHQRRRDTTKGKELKRNMDILLEMRSKADDRYNTFNKTEPKSERCKKAFEESTALRAALEHVRAEYYNYVDGY